MDYAIGDVQGCFEQLKQLLKAIDFSQDKDRLFFLGDVVNRGPKSLKTLRFIKTLYESGNAHIVLGNHDFHLLICGFGALKKNHKDTFTDILKAKDKWQLLDFLRNQKLLIEVDNNLLVHAGIPPQWHKKRAFSEANRIELMLKNDDIGKTLKSLYCELAKWQKDGSDLDKARYTLNALTRMRFCDENGDLTLKHKGDANKAPKGYQAWFNHKNKISENIIFGHWSTLKKTNKDNRFALDGGCVWGKSLKAIALANKQVTKVKCSQFLID